MSHYKPFNKSTFIYGFAIFGLLLTGIILPFLGLFVVKLHRGNYLNFFGEAGSIARIALPLFTLSLLGSFGVVPRCITVAHGGLNYLIPQLPLAGFSFLFCIATFVLCLKDRHMLQVIGQWMSPCILLILASLVVAGLLNITPNNITAPTSSVTPSSAFTNGFAIGYQTMDLFAAFFFSALVFSQLEAQLPKNSTNKEILLLAIPPSIIGMILLAFVYFGLVFLGAYFALMVENMEPELMLAAIAKHVMGEASTVLFAIAVLLSCLTTAITLNGIYAKYLCTFLRLRQSMYAKVLLCTTLISFIISLYDFRGIASFIAPMLEISYPSIIGLTILSLGTHKLRTLKSILFYGGLMIMVAFKIL